jgi:hypothetical protein
VQEDCRRIENSLCCAVDTAAQVDGTGMLCADLVQQVCSPDVVHVQVTIMHWHFHSMSAYGLPSLTPIDTVLLLIGSYAGMPQTMLNPLEPTLQRKLIIDHQYTEFKPLAQGIQTILSARSFLLAFLSHAGNCESIRKFPFI